MRWCHRHRNSVFKSVTFCFAVFLLLKLPKQLLSWKFRSSCCKRHCFKVDSKGFRRWCITLGITGFLDFVQKPSNSYCFEDFASSVCTNYWVLRWRKACLVFVLFLRDNSSVSIMSPQFCKCSFRLEAYWVIPSHTQCRSEWLQNFLFEF
jgi:hypothetical protein